MNRETAADNTESLVEHYSSKLLILSEEHQDYHVCNYFLEQIKTVKPAHVAVFELANQFKIRCKFAFAIDTLSRLVDEEERTPAIWVRLGEYSGLAGFPENQLHFFRKALSISPNLAEKFWFVKALSDAAFELDDVDYAKSVLYDALENNVTNDDEKKVLLNSFVKLGNVGCFLDITNNVKQKSSFGVDEKSFERNILIIDSVIPRYDQDAGSVLMQGFIRSLTKSGYKVWFYSGEKEPEKKYVTRLLENNVRYIAAKYVGDISEFLRIIEPEIDTFMLTRANVGGLHFDAIRNANPRKPIIFNSVDLHYLRLERLYKSSGHSNHLLEAKRLKRRESYLVRNSDASIVISDAEVSLLEKAGIMGNIWQLPIIVEFPESVPEFSSRKHIAFVGSYVHTPNVDAVDHFCSEIWPNIYSRFKDTNLLIVGPKAPGRWMKQYHNKNNVEVVGFVEDLESLLADIKCTIVPLRFGAGQKGKIATSLAHGVPCISTEIGIEGMGLSESETVLISEDEKSWKNNLKEVLNNEETWTRLSTLGQEFAYTNFSEPVVGGKLVAEINEMLLVA